MLKSRAFFLCPGKSTRSGFTRTEALLLVGLLLILVFVALGPISRHLEETKINSAVENARSINTLLAQDAIDNNDIYPVGLGTSVPGTSAGIARNLLQERYASNPAIFALGSRTVKYGGTASDFSDFNADNIGWDFTGGATTITGITSSASEFLPTLYGTGETVAYPKTAGTGLDLTLSGQGPFSSTGMVVAYKGNNAAFIPGTVSGATVICRGFISTSFKDAAIYTQIRP